MNFAIVHYNTPELTTCLIGSIYKNHKHPKIFIFENSTTRPIQKSSLYTIFDNTHGQLINFDEEIRKNTPCDISDIANFGSFKHALSIQWLIDTINEPFVLLDSDVLIKQPLDEICDEKVFFSAGIQYGDPSKIYPKNNRALPFCCFINVPLLKYFDMKYTDPKRMIHISHSRGWYDTGSSFYYDVAGNDLPFNEIDLDKYIVHFYAGSWRDGRNHKGVTQSKEIWLMHNEPLWRLSNV